MEKKDNRESRRKFLRRGALAGGAAVLGLTVGLPAIAKLDKSGQMSKQLGVFSFPVVDASVTMPQTAIDPLSIPKFVDPMPSFVGARVNAFLHRKLRIDNAELQEKILPASIYAGLSAPYSNGTYVWGYSVNDGCKTSGPFYPAFTIEARRHIATKVSYSNSLSNTQLQKYLTIDQTIHWADPDNMMDMNMREPYTGPQPVVTHLHGGEVHSRSDGGPDAWFLPNFTKRGPAWTYGGVTSEYTYPNDQEAATLFYHDHCLGATRINLYAGLVGFYFIRDIFDTGIPGTGLKLPAGPYEMEMAIQDKMFDTNGQLLFPDGSGQNADGSTPAGLSGGPPNPDIHPYWIPEFFGDVMLVNGKSWPYLNVEPRRYRFRVVDGCNARFLNLSLPGLKFWIIGTDGGLLDKPVAVDQLFIAPGERADIIIDFASAKGTEVIMTNDAPAPYPMGDTPDPNTNGTIMKFVVGTTITGYRDRSFDPAKVDARLRGGRYMQPAIVRLSDGNGALNPKVRIHKRRMLTLLEIPGEGGPIAPILNNTGWEGKREDGTPIPGFKQLGPNWLSELPEVGSTEQWDIINMTMDAHPIHLHLVQFQLINRQNFNLGVNFDTDEVDPNGYRALYDSLFPGGNFIPFYGPPLAYNTPNNAQALGGNPDVTAFLQNTPEKPQPWETGWKDTFKMMPGQVTRIVVRFAPQDVNIEAAKPGKNSYSFDPTTGPGYVWHCHIVDHEDNEMMRPYIPVKTKSNGKC